MRPDDLGQGRVRRLGRRPCTPDQGARLRVPWVVPAAFALALAALRLFVVEPYTVASDSMVPAVEPGSYAVMLRLPGTAERVQLRDLVVFKTPDAGETVLKRVVAVGGQEVSIRDSLLYVDGRRVDEPGIDASAIDGTWFGPVDVPEGAVFVLGDNRAASIDSRDYGSIALEAVRGKVLWTTGP